jgi:hypothetical protein
MSLQAAGQIVGVVAGAIVSATDAAIENIKRMERFNQVYSAMTVDVTMADKASKSLIKTMTLMAQTNKMAQTTIGLTSKMLKDITVMTTKFAQVTGQDATEVFKNFSQALLSGSTEVFRPYGIVIEGITGIQNIQAEVMRQVTARAKGMHVEIESLNEVMSSLNNTVGTMVDRFGSAVINANKLTSESDALSMTLTTMFGNLETGINRTLDLWEKWIDKINKSKESAEELRKVQRQVFAQRLAIGEGLTAAERGFIEGLTEKQWMALQLVAMGGGKPTAPKGPLEGPLTDEQIDAILQGKGDFPTRRAQAPDERRRGARAEKPGLPTEAAISQLGADEMRARVDAALEELRRLHEGETGMIEHEHSRRIVSYEEFLAKRREQEAQRLEAELRLFENQEWRQHQKEMWRLEDEIREQDHILRMEHMWETSWDFRLSKMQEFFAAGAGLMGASAALQRQMDAEADKQGKARNKKMKRMWQVGKVAAMGEIIINTSRAAMGAFASLSQIPFVGPVLGGVAAALIAATGAIQLALVRRQTFEGATGNTAGAAISRGGGAAALGGGGAGAPSYPQPQGGAQEINITLTMGDELAWMDSMIDANDSASQGRRPHFEVTGRAA